jgi:hypothetical protein
MSLRSALVGNVAFRVGFAASVAVLAGFFGSVGLAAGNTAVVVLFLIIAVLAAGVLIMTGISARRRD